MYKELKECFLADINRLSKVIEKYDEIDVANAEEITDELAIFADCLRNYTVNICLTALKGE